MTAFLQILLARAPVAMMILGASVLAGWGLHIPFLVRLNSDSSPWPPMSQWTAICFFLLGWTYLGKRTWQYSIWVASVIGLVALFFLVEQLFEVSLGDADHFFSDYWSFHYSPFHGRMALGTAICFLLSAIAISVRTKSARELLGSAITALAALHLLNFTMDPARIHLNPLSMMATHTALGFAGWGLYLSFGGGHKDGNA